MDSRVTARCVSKVGGGTAVTPWVQFLVRAECGLYIKNPQYGGTRGPFLGYEPRVDCP